MKNNLRAFETKKIWGAYEPNSDKIPASAYVYGIICLVIVFGYVPFLKFMIGA
jgi:hypothetical protein